MLVKAEYNKVLVSSYIEDLIEFYDNTKPFITIEERNNYELEILELMEDKYGRLNGSGYYSIKTLTSLVELFSKCEKQSKLSNIAGVIDILHIIDDKTIAPQPQPTEFKKFYKT